MVVCGVGVRRGVAWCVRSQVVGMATWRGAREETGARTRRVRAFSAHALPAQAMRLTANTKIKKTVTVDAPRYQVVLVDITLDRLMTCTKR